MHFYCKKICCDDNLIIITPTFIIEPFLFVFFPVILLGYYGLMDNLKVRNVFLLLVSMIFYAWGEPSYVVIMMISICINFKVGLLIDKEEREDIKKQILMAGVFINILFLFIFKYEGFISDNLSSLVGAGVPLRITSLNLPLPIGISFFTFQAVSYLVDVYRKSAPVQESLLDLGLYIAFFPQLVAGPIVRYSTIAEQIKERFTTYEQFTVGVKRFIIGMGKKIIFANQFALIATASFEHESPSVSFAWLGAICYTLQIYYDFSGYSDMAIGLGKMFGFDFMENFNYPYVSKTVTEFWRRWHISLGAWFRDYVYIPLGGSRVGKIRLVFNLFAVWMLTGIWHGAAYQFIVWGLLYFVLLTFEKVTNIESKLTNFITKGVYQIFTMLMVVLGWVIFGETTFADAVLHLKHMLGLQEAKITFDNDFLRNINNDGVLLVAGIILATPLLLNMWRAIEKKILSNRSGADVIYQYIKEYTMAFVYMFVFMVAVSYLVMGAHNPFIYFNF